MFYDLSRKLWEVLIWVSDVPDVDEKLGNEMADVIAQVMRLAEYYNIDLEKAFIEAREDEDRYLQSRGV